MLMMAFLSSQSDLHEIFFITTSSNHISSPNVLCIDPLSSHKAQNIDSFICDIKPDILFHFASLNRSSDTAGILNNELFASNVGFTEDLFNACLNFSPKTIFVSSGSIHQFSDPKIVGSYSLPLRHNETIPSLPRNYYGFTKSINEIQSNFYRSLGLSVYHMIFFNHESPYHSTSFLIPKIFNLAADLHFKSTTKDIPRIIMFDPNFSINVSLAKDVVSLVFQIVNKDPPDTYYIGSSTAFNVNDIIKALNHHLSVDLLDYISISSDNSSQFRIPSCVYLAASNQTRFTPFYNVEDFTDLLFNQFLSQSTLNQ